MVELRVLGPVEVVGDDGDCRPVVGARPRAIVLALALAGRGTVSGERLIGEVWGDSPPASPLDTLQSHLSRLRRTLEPGRVAHAASSGLPRAASGYRFDPDVVSIDARVFEAEVGAARQLLGADAEGAVRLLGQALSRWRGEIGEGIELGPATRAEATRLEELRIGALESRLVAELGLGRHAEVVAELEPLVSTHPVRERLHGLRMLALYRCGRQAEALAAYREAREQLVESLGVEPSRQLHQLHERMLAHDPQLEPRGTGGPTGDALGETLGTASSEGPTGAMPAPVADGGRTDPEPDGAVRPRPTALGNLPAALVDLVGRDEQRRQLAEVLAAERLVTLVGAGGCGKTQLAIAVAGDAAGTHADGVWWVELQARNDPALVPGAVAEVLGVEDRPLPALHDALAARVAGRDMLLVLDNCEHVIDACAGLVQELLVHCPQLHVLATSRQPLDVDGERLWRVPSLSLPSADADLEGLAGSDAAQLFLRRAADARPGYVPTEDDAHAVAAICRELDGIPLAIELAAARLRVVSAEEVAERLDDRFRMLRSARRGAPPRHRTLDAAIGWSFDLLTPPAQLLFRRLAIFQSGFTLAAAEAVCPDGDPGTGPPALSADAVLELLDTLVDQSLVQTVPGPVGPARHDLLESIRSYAWTRIETEELECLRRRHARWFAELADTAAEELTGADQVRWLNRLHLEHDDLRAALSWSLEHDEPEVALRIGAGVWWFWLQFGHALEGSQWLERVLAATASGADLDPDVLLRARYGAGRLAAAVDRPALAREHFEAGAALAQDLDRPGRQALCQAQLAQVLDATGVREPARRAFSAAEEAAARSNDRWVEAGVSSVAGVLAVGDGDLDRAAVAFRGSTQRYLETHDRWSACLSRLGEAWVARRSGALSTAVRLHLENLRATRDLTRSAYDFVGLARDLLGLAVLASSQAHDEAAARLCGASENLRTMGEVALTRDERAEIDEVVDRARVVLGPDGVADAMAGGRSMAADEALEDAVALSSTLLAMAVAEDRPEPARRP